MAHPRIERTLATAGMTAVLLTLPLAGAGWTLGLDDATGVLPEPVADAVDDATAPIKDAVEPQAPVVEQVVESVVQSAPAPVRDAAAKIAPAAPSTGPVGQSPVPAPAAPGTWGTPVKDSSSAPVSAPAPAAAPDSGYARARQALLSQPVSTTPFPALDALMGAELPLTAADEARGASRTSDPRTGPSPWLVATATGMLVLLGAAHIAYADGRLSRTTA